MEQITNVLFVGVGGQGVLTASDILARAAFLAGHAVKKSEIHGMSQRGGGVTSTVRFGREIRSPLAPSGSIDFLMALDRTEGEKYLAELAPGGEALFLDDALAARVANPRAVNTALLGRLSSRLDIPQDAWEKAIAMEVPAKYVAMNIEAFRVGRENRGPKPGARQ